MFWEHYHRIPDAPTGGCDLIFRRMSSQCAHSVALDICQGCGDMDGSCSERNLLAANSVTFITISSCDLFVVNWDPFQLNLMSLPVSRLRFISCSDWVCFRWELRLFSARFEFAYCKISDRLVWDLHLFAARFVIASCKDRVFFLQGLSLLPKRTETDYCKI